MPSNFIAMVYAVLKQNGIDTRDMKPDEAIEKFNELRGGGSRKPKAETTEQKKQRLDEYEAERERQAAKYGEGNSADGKPRSEKGNVSNDGKTFRQVSPKEFVETLKKAKATVPEVDRWRVDIHDESEYKNDKLFVSLGGSCVAIEPDGNIISVCHNASDTVRGRDLLALAVKHGGNRLDAFGGLYWFYSKYGFEPVSWTPFDKKYAPDGWTPELDKEPVIFWKYTGTQTKFSKKDFLNKVKPNSDYDLAKEIRDRSAKNDIRRVRK